MSSKKEFCQSLIDYLAEKRQTVMSFEEEDRTLRLQKETFIHELYMTELAARQYGGIQPDVTTDLLT